MKAAMKKMLRALPSVTSLLEHEEVVDWLHGSPRAYVVGSLQAAIDEARGAILAGDEDVTIDPDDLVAEAEVYLLERSTPSLRGVINATGIVLHTGLGRAPPCEAAVEAIAEGIGGYCNLEYDLETGQRGKRQAHVALHLAELTGAEAATVVNNNAAATLLILQTLALGKEVVVSRGQLVEIGGSFRLPDIIRAAGVTLNEVGTTNRTRASDYQQAIGSDTAALMRVHTSNYRIEGFCESVDIEELAELAHRFELPVVDDLGSGALFDLKPLGLPDEPHVQASVDAGADLVCFSGDKLLGGPQCGIIVGRQDLIDQIEANPLMRTYRVGKMTLLALEATLRCYADRDQAPDLVPALTMLTATTDALAHRAEILVELLSQALPDEHFFVGSGVAYAGGGALPARELTTVIVQWRPTGARTNEIATALRDADDPVIARIRDEAICFDLRTIRDDDLESLVDAIASVILEEDGEEEDSDDVSLPIL